MVSSHRPIAEGFPKAPLIEAVIDVTFGNELSPAEVEAVREALRGFYPEGEGQPVREFHVDVETDTITVRKDKVTYRCEGKDATELALIRPNGFGISQLAPYRSWDEFIGRFSRDLAAASGVLGDRTASRLATRFINRIDVPTVDGIARYEEYLAVHISLPEQIQSIGPFQFGFNLRMPDQKAQIVIQSSVVDPAIEDVASFLLDIDVSRVEDVPESWDDALKIIDGFRDIKNFLYKTLLTEKAREEFA